MQYLTIEYIAIIILVIILFCMVSFLIRLSNMVDKEREENEAVKKRVKMATYGFSTEEDFSKCEALSWEGTIYDIKGLKEMEEDYETLEEKHETLGKNKHALNERYVLLLGRVQSLPLATLKKYKLQYVLDRKGRQSSKKK